MIECKLCHKFFKNMAGLSNHIRVHSLDSKEYYDKYLKIDENDGICYCGQKTYFVNMCHGYRKYCSVKCMRNSVELKDQINKNVSKSMKDNIPWNRGLTKETDIRVQNNAKSVKKARQKLSSDGKLTAWNKGLQTPENVRKKQSKSAMGKLISKKTRYKHSYNAKHGITGMKGKHHSNETRLKISVATIKHLEKTVFDGGPMYPNVGKNESRILDQLESECNIHFRRNDYKIALEIGKFPDGYSQKYNLVVEIMEDHHYDIDGKLRKCDQEREDLIKDELKCEVYNISEKEFLKNPSLEISKFRNFINKLDMRSKIC